MGDARTQALARKPSTCRPPPVRARQPGKDRGPVITARIQPALRVGAANDPMEHEAEAMAEKVATMSAPAGAAAPMDVSDDATSDAAQARRSDIPQIDQDSQPDTDTFESAPAVPADHQDPDVPNTEDVDTAGLEDDEFGEIESGEPVAARAVDDGGPAVGAEGGAAPADVTRSVAQPGTGRPLPASVRAFMEPRFGVGFHDVRIHDAPDDRRTAERIGARAFTHRNHIWLGEGESVDDRRLLAHELTHVVQQTKRPATAGGPAQAEPARRNAGGTIRRGWVADKAEKVARNVPGYFLLTVILGKSPITGNRVERNATNLIGGFLGLLPGGNLLFEKLQETRALQKAFDWVSQRLSQLNITWSRIKRLVGDFIDEMPAWSPLKVAKRIFSPLVRDIITFVKDIKDKILEFILKGALMLAGSWGEKIWGVIQKVGQTISLILSDPLGFAKNLIGAIVGGFRRFSSNIWKHIKAGLMGWLFGAMQGLEIELPQKLDFKGILSVVLQIVGLTYANFRKILVKRLGKNGEQKVAFLEKSVEAVKVLIKEGFVGIWQRVIEAIEGFKTTVIEGIRDFVITSLVQGAVSWIAGLTNPVGAIVKVALSIYNMIKTFLERMEQIAAIFNGIFSSLSEIAKGKVEQAAQFIEKTLAASIPVFLAFVAALIPVNGITSSIRNIMKKLQAPVKKAMDKLVTFFVKKAKKLFSRILGKVNKKRKLKQHGFVIGKEAHKLIPKKKGKSFELRVASKDQGADAAQKTMAKEAKTAAEYGDDSTCVDAFEKAFKLEIDQAQDALEDVKHDQQKSSTKKQGDKAEKDVADAGKKLSKLGPCIADNPFLEDEPQDGAIIRAREPRIDEIEGMKVEGEADTYNARSNVTKQKIDVVAGKAKLKKEGARRLSLYYENDHIPEKGLGKEVQKYVQGKLKKEIDKGARDGSKLPEPSVGTVNTLTISEKGGALPAITVYRPLHRQKTNETKRDYKAVIDAADAKATPAEKIAELRVQVAAEMNKEREHISGLYRADKAANAKIRANVQGGMTALGQMNKKIFGINPGARPKLPKGKGNDAEGSDLPMEGGTGDMPDFTQEEGKKKQYSKAKGFGKYLEYDHVVEKTLALKAKKLNWATETLKGMAATELDAAAAQQAEKETGELGEKARSAAQVKKTAEGRLSRAPFVNAAITTDKLSEYTAGKANTVALYRPVHQSLSSKRGEIKGTLFTPEDLADVRKAMVDFAVSNPIDNAKKEEAGALIKQKTHDKFDTEIGAHTTLIKDEYRAELKEFMRLNSSKEAAAKMGAVIERIGGTLRELRSESLDLVK